MRKRDANVQGRQVLDKRLGVSRLHVSSVRSNLLRWRFLPPEEASPSGTTSNREELALEPADGSADLERQGERQQNPFCCRGPTQDRPSQRHRTPVASEAIYETPIKYSRPGNRLLGAVPFDPPRAAYRLTGWWQQRGGRSLVASFTLRRFTGSGSDGVGSGVGVALGLSHHCDGFRSSLDGMLPVQTGNRAASETSAAQMRRRPQGSDRRRSEK